MPREQGLGDREVHHRIAKELEALIVIARSVGMLVQVTAVDERLVEKVRIPEGEAEPGRERGGGAGDDAALAGRVIWPRQEACSSM
jgi:hypothetical protein